MQTLLSHLTCLNTGELSPPPKRLEVFWFHRLHKKFPCPYYLSLLVRDPPGFQISTEIVLKVSLNLRTPQLFLDIFKLFRLWMGHIFQNGSLRGPIYTDFILAVGVTCVATSLRTGLFLYFGVHGQSIHLSYVYYKCILVRRGSVFYPLPELAGMGNVLFRPPLPSPFVL